MPRYRRQIAEGSVQHVISRFVNREFRFEVAHARTEYLRRAALALARTDWRALGFTLMSSHVHWAMLAGRRPSSALIKPLHAGFAGWLNDRQKRLGPVFADRHRTLTFEAETAAALLAYIHNNPVRAGVVADPADSLWTSHRAYLGLVPPPPWLDVKRGLSLCGFSATPSGRLGFHEMVVARANEARRTELSGGDMHVRRRVARAAMQAPVEIAAPVVTLGDGVLHLEEQGMHNLQAGDAHRRARRSVWHGEASTVVELVERATGTELAQLRSLSRRRIISQARRLALVTWTRELQRPTAELARELGLSSSSAAQLIRTPSASTLAAAAALGREIRRVGNKQN